jgi:hypothetical protein
VDRKRMVEVFGHILHRCETWILDDAGSCLDALASVVRRKSWFDEKEVAFFVSRCGDNRHGGRLRHGMGGDVVRKKAEEQIANSGR